MVVALLMSILIKAAPPPALKALVTEARIAATSDETNGGVSKELVARAEAIQKYGAQAIPLVMPLLQHPSPGVRNFIGYVVSDLPGFTQRELEPLIAAYRGGNGWVASAIGTIDSPRARDFLVEAFVAKPQRHSGLGNALIRLGERGAAALVGLLRSKQPVQPLFANEACGIFMEIGQAVRNVTPELLSILKDARLPTANRLAALRLLGCGCTVSESTRLAVDAALKADKPLASEEGARRSQIALGTPEAIARTVSRLAEHPEEVSYLAIAGQSARSAEPAVLRLVEHEDADIRLAALQTLGALGSDSATDHLTKFLTDVRDWRAPCAAARSLAQLKAIKRKEAIAAAERAAWFPQTAKCLRAALRLLESGRAPENDRALWSADDEKKVPPALAPRRGPGELDARELKKLSVTGAIHSFAENGEMVTENVTNAPSFGLKIDGGVLAGTNRGEWGGELVLLPPDAGQQVLVEKNVAGIHRLGALLVVVTGLGHLSLREGMLYRVAPGADGVLKATEWRVLPGAPEKSFVLPNGRLYISCSGADIVVDEAGTISLATRALVE